MSHIHKRISGAELVSLIIPLVLMLVLFGGYDQLDERPDSGSYLNFADAIISGEIFTTQDPSDLRFYRLARTPGYPLIVVVAKTLFPDETTGLLYLHLLFAALSIVFLSLALRAWCAPVMTGLIVVAAQILMKDYFFAVMTEWVVFNLLLVIFGMLIVSIRNSSLRNLFVLGLLASLTVLIRPTIAPALLVMPFLFLYRWKFHISEMLVLSLTVAPIVLWMTFNWYQLGSFSLSKLDGHLRYSVGSMIGYADEIPGDSDELKTFIREVNTKKVPAKGDEDEFVVNYDETYNMIRVQSNLFWVAYKLKDADKGLLYFDSEILGVYGRRAISNNVDNYIEYVRHGMKVFLQQGSPYVAVYLLIIPLIGLARRKSLILCWSTLAMFAIHLLQGLLCAAYLFVFKRYAVLTLYPYLVSVAICLCGLIYAEGYPARLRKYLRSLK